MQLKVLLPFGIFAQIQEVTRIVITTRSGSFGLLPHRLDCVAALRAGILSYSTAAGETHLAIDNGVLIKTGADVLVCVRHAIGGSDLGNLSSAVDREFLQLDANERSTRSTLAQLEGGFVRRLMELQHG